LFGDDVKEVELEVFDLVDNDEDGERSDLCSRECELGTEAGANGTVLFGLSYVGMLYTKKRLKVTDTRIEILRSILK
jgi:hypothetical protein